MTTMVVPIHDPSKTNDHVFGVNEDTDMRLSQLTENSLMISTTHEITKLNNNTLSKLDRVKLYSNGLFNMTSSSPSTTTSSREGSTKQFKSCTAMAENSSAPIGTTSAMPQTTDVAEDVGHLANFPDCWNGWESKRRSESMIHWKKYQQKKQLRIRKRIKRKNIEPTKARNSVSVTNFHCRRLSLDRSIGRYPRGRCLNNRQSALKTTQDSTQSEVVPFQSSKSLRRRQRPRVVRFREEISEELLDWKREQLQRQQKGVSSGRGLGTAADTESPFLEAQRERKRSQRALLDLQVGMKCMGL